VQNKMKMGWTMAPKATALLGALLLAAPGASAQAAKLKVDLDSSCELSSRRRVFF
jgi:hypothetical protein